MSEVVVYNASGGRVWMSLLGTVADLAWSSRWGAGPSGPFEASWSMDLPANSSHPAFTPGRRVEIFDGPARVFAGLLSEPDRGEPWSFHARGLSRAGDEYLCLDATGATTSVPSVAVDQAISRGLPWVRYETSLSAGAFSASSSTTDLNRIPGLLDAWAEEQKRRWGVNADGQFFTATDPTTPTWVLSPGAGVMGVADDEYASHVYGRYVSSVDANGDPNGWATVVASDANAATRWGRREYPLDLTPLGLMDAARASTLTQGRLARASARMGFTNPITATRDELTTVGGIPARLSQVKAGDLLRINGVLDSVGNLAVAGTVDVVLGEVRYEDGADSIYLAPVGLVPRSLSDVLAAPAAPVEVFAG